MSAYDNQPPLPGTKTGSPATPLGSTGLTATEFNNLVQATADLRTAVQQLPQSGGPVSLVTLLQNLTPPASEATKSKLYTDGARFLTLLNGRGEAIEVNPHRYNVKDFGAKGDNVTDDTAAINACLLAAYQRFNGGGSNGSINYNTRPVVYFPEGLYKISGPLSFTYAFEVISEGAVIIQTDNTKDIFNAVNGTGVTPGGNQAFTVRGVWFVGGKDHISFDSNNVNNTIMRIENCFFINPAVGAACVHPGPLHKGLTTVERCFFWTVDTGGRVGQIDGGDETVFKECYAGVRGDSKVFQVTNQVGLKLDGWFGTPGVAGGGSWVEVTGPASISVLNHTRWGGEQQMYGVDWKAVGGTLVCRDNHGPYNNGAPCWRFYKAPAMVDLDPKDAGGTGVWFDPSMSSADQQNFGGIIFHAPGFNGRPTASTASSLTPFDVGSNMFCLQQVRCSLGDHRPAENRNRTVQASDYLQAFFSNNVVFNTDSSQNNVNVVGGTNLFGGVNNVATATGSPANWAIHSPTWLLNLPNGQYTLVIDCEVTAPTYLIVSAGTDGAQASYILLPGDPAPHFTFTRGAATASQTIIGVNFASIPNGGTVTLNRVRLYSGKVLVPDMRAVHYASAAPVTGLWQQGDEIVYPQPAAGASPGLVCTTGGWATKGAWAQSTGYTRGDYVTNLGNVYICVQTGTSSNAGAGPNSSVYPVTDGTCLWAQIGTSGGIAPVFKAKPNLAA